MQTLTFMESTDTPDRMRRRIRATIETRHAIRIDELCMRTGLPADLLRAELGSMVLNGMIERLRPMGYDKDDLDCYAVVKPGGYPWED